MTVIEALKKTVDEEGNIIIPIGSIRGTNESPGTVTEAWMQLAFGAQMDQTLPLSESQFDTLKNTIQGQWQDNWQWFRDNAVI